MTREGSTARTPQILPRALPVKPGAFALFQADIQFLFLCLSLFLCWLWKIGSILQHGLWRMKPFWRSQRFRDRAGAGVRVGGRGREG